MIQLNVLICSKIFGDGEDFMLSHNCPHKKEHIIKVLVLSADYTDAFLRFYVSIELFFILKNDANNSNSNHIKKFSSDFLH